jgi:hypothetical protein
MPTLAAISVRSEARTTVDAQIGHGLLLDLGQRLDVFNLFNAQNNDISYCYESHLPGELDAGAADKHFHPAQPRSFRVTLS